jgi:hypothetical protein
MLAVSSLVASPHANASSNRCVQGILEAMMAENCGVKTVDELMAEHRALDAQVEALSKRPYLTEAEHLEHVILKKKRLRARDELFELSRAMNR